MTHDDEEVKEIVSRIRERFLKRCLDRGLTSEEAEALFEEVKNRPMKWKLPTMEDLDRMVAESERLIALARLIVAERGANSDPGKNPWHLTWPEEPVVHPFDEFGSVVTLVTKKNLLSDDMIEAGQNGSVVWAFPTSYLVEFMVCDGEGAYQTSWISEYELHELECKSDGE